MKKILITGASGFIGRQVTKEMIKRGYVVYAPSIMQTLSPQKNLIQSELDLFDTDALSAYLCTSSASS